MKIKRISIFLACVLLFSCFPLQSFADAAKNLQFELRVDTENNNDSVISADENNVVVEAGGEFTVDLYLRNTSDDGPYTITDIQHEIEFDENFFEFVKAETVKATSAMKQTDVSYTCVRTYFFGRPTEFDNDQCLTRVTFKVKGEVGDTSSLISTPRIDANDSTLQTDYSISTKDMTVTVGERLKYVVEVGEDYVAGKKLVLVYTDEELTFTYDGDAMYEVTDKGYKYEAPDGTEDDHVYAHVYALVVDAINGGDLDAYKAKVESVENGTAEKIDYTNKHKITGDIIVEINGAQALTWNDITAAYNAITNDGRSYKRFMAGCIKVDVNGDKHVTSADAEKIVSAYNEYSKNK